MIWFSKFRRAKPRPQVHAGTLVLSSDELSKHVPKSRERARIAKEFAALDETGLFEPNWYLEQNPDVAASGFPPMLHFLLHGAKEGRRPHPLFFNDWYLSTNPDVAAADLNPLLHYVRDGGREGREPDPFFRTGEYLQVWPDCRDSGQAPLVHFMRRIRSSAGAARYLQRSPGLPRSTPTPPLSPCDRLARYLVASREFIGGASESERASLIANSGLFDADFYRSSYPDLSQTDLSPLLHYLRHGAHEGRRPHPLFDVRYYLDQAPGLREAGINPLLHYLVSGAEEGSSPNLFLDPDWYLEHNADYAASGLTPLAHFARDGGVTSNPGPHFNAVGYLRSNQDVAASGANPLVHFLRHGIAEGRTFGRNDIAARPGADVASARIACLKRNDDPYKSVALFVTHAPNGAIKPYVEHHIRALKANNVDIALVIAADLRKTYVPRDLVDVCRCVYVRDNVGMDFAAWAHVLREDPRLFAANMLILVNDSIVGPTSKANFESLLREIEHCDADVIGLTDNVYHAWHLQSFFLALKRNALSSYGLHQFFNEVENVSEKEMVIHLYELTLAARLKRLGLECVALFPGDYEGMNGLNRVIFNWRELNESGFPFVKASLLFGEHTHRSGSEVAQFLREHGLDAMLGVAARPSATSCVVADLEVAAREPARRPRVSLIGVWNVANGLGVASRSYLSAMLRLDWDTDFNPIQRPFHIHARTAPAWRAASFSGAPDVALVHVNGDGWTALLDEQQNHLLAQAGLVVGLFVWEFSTIPDEWLTTLDRLDAIWAPTDFCAEIFRRYTDVPVHVVPYVVEVDAPRQITHAQSVAMRRKLGLHSDKRIILYAFDGSSFLARKNPHALIRAFNASGLADENWQLVLKTKHLFEIESEARKLMEAIENNPDITVLDRPFSREDLSDLFALADIYASSHSSEGFGLTIAEAMAMGKIVVATDFGGSRDFLDATCGFPVRAVPAALAESIGPYARGGAWADVDETDLCRALRDAANACISGDDIGARARGRIEERLSLTAVARAMERSVDTLLARKKSGRVGRGRPR